MASLETELGRPLTFKQLHRTRFVFDHKNEDVEAKVGRFVSDLLKEQSWFILGGRRDWGGVGTSLDCHFGCSFAAQGCVVIFDCIAV